MCVADAVQDVFGPARTAASQIAPSQPVIAGGATDPEEIAAGAAAGVAARVEVAAAANAMYKQNKKLLEENGFDSVAKIPHEQPLTITHHDVRKVVDEIKASLAGATKEARETFDSNFTLLTDAGFATVEDVPVGAGRERVRKDDVLDLLRSIRSEAADGGLMSSQQVMASHPIPLPAILFHPIPSLQVTAELGEEEEESSESSDSDGGSDYHLDGKSAEELNKELKEQHKLKRELEAEMVAAEKNVTDSLHAMRKSAMVRAVV